MKLASLGKPYPIISRGIKKYRPQLISLYITGIALCGIFILAIAFTSLQGNLSGLLIFALLASLSELFSVELFISARNSRISVSSIIAIASILSFGAWAGAITMAMAGIIISVMPHFSAEKPRSPLIQRAAFNLGMLTISIASAGWVYAAAGGRIGNFDRLTNLIPLALCVLTNELINTSILLGMLVLQTGKKPLKLWSEDFRWSLPIDLLGGLIGSSALAWVYGRFGVMGLVIFFVPILAMGYSYRLYANNMRSYVNRLEKLNQDLDEINVDLLNTLSAVIDASDIYTNGHSRQVAIYAGDIAEKMGFSTHDHEILVMAALLHDVGKVGISDSILGKNARLENDEFSKIKLHSTIGAEILRHMKGMQEVVPMVKHHHERWDGSGYPDQLKGEDIPLGARIINLADSLDTICSDRPWRPTRSFEEVIKEIQHFSGTQFDPNIVNILLELVEERGKEYLKNSAILVDELNQISDGEKMGNKIRYLKRSMILDEEHNL